MSTDYVTTITHEVSTSAKPVVSPTEAWYSRIYTDLSAIVANNSLPRPMRFRDGFAPGRRGGARVVAEYVPGDKAEDGIGSVYMSPMHGSTPLVVVALLREAIRAYTYKAPKADKAFKEYCQLYGIVGGFRYDETPEINEALEDHISAIIGEHPTRPHSALIGKQKPQDAQKTYLLSGVCPECLGKHRPTEKTLKGSWPICNGSGSHRLVYIGVSDTEGQPLDPYNFVANSAIRSNGDGTYSPL